jgi:malonate transporter
MLSVVGLITPVFAVIVVGYWARHSGFLTDGFWAPAEKLGYRILLPALIIDSIATNQMPANAADFGTAIVLTVLTISLPMLALRAFMRSRGKWHSGGFASVHQGSLRLNGLLAIASCVALLGDQALPLIGILVAVWVPVSNGLSVYAYVADGAETRPLKIITSVLANPMVFAVLIGGALNLLGLGPLIDSFFLFEMLGRAALPVGLLTVGAALNLAAMRRPGARVMSALVLKLLVMPMLMLAFCHWLQASPLVTAVALICSAMPSSPSGYLVARQLGGDHELMATIITAQTLVGVITVTAWASYAVSLV